MCITPRKIIDKNVINRSFDMIILNVIITSKICKYCRVLIEIAGSHSYRITWILMNIPCALFSPPILVFFLNWYYTFLLNFAVFCIKQYPLLPCLCRSSSNSTNSKSYLACLPKLMRLPLRPTYQHPLLI